MNSVTGTTEPILRVDGLSKFFPVKGGMTGQKTVGHIRAVDSVSFDLGKRDTLGIVGESGCGKSTTARTLLRMMEPTAGSVLFRGEDVATMSTRRFRRFRREMQFVFQDPYSSLDPRMTIGKQVMEPWTAHPDVVPKKQRAHRAKDLLSRVGLGPEAFNRYPREFSGGQRQRIGIARSLALEPEILICDEPVSALDVSVQAQVINLLEELQSDLGLSYVFIAHDLAVVRRIADRVAVMYLGKVVELGAKDEIYNNALHPYTQALMAAAPSIKPQAEQTASVVPMIQGDVPSPADPPSGCAFRTRCWKATDLCAEEVPDLVKRTASDTLVACHYADE